MSAPGQPIPRIERVLLVMALALLLFATPVIYWWAQDDSPWYLVYVLWLLIIVLGASFRPWRGRRDL